MYERFTDHARNVLKSANEEAERFQHEYVGTEHVLLALLQQDGGAAANVLRNLGVDLKKLQREVEKLARNGPELEAMSTGKLPQTPRTRNVIELALEEALNLKQKHVGTEHILLGLLCDQECFGGEFLRNEGLSVESVRNEVCKLVGQGLES